MTDLVLLIGGIIAAIFTALTIGSRRGKKKLLAKQKERDLKNAKYTRQKLDDDDRDGDPDDRLRSQGRLRD